MTLISATVQRPHHFDPLLHDSRTHCEQITRRHARNFYYGLKLLPEPKRSQMYALYAYMRLLDDIADADDGRSYERRLADLEAWRGLTHDVLDGRRRDTEEEAGGPTIWPAFADLVRRRGVPRHLFDDAIAGQRQDLSSPAFATFDDLHEYCYRVAGVVGMASLYVWGFEGGEDTLDLAIRRGVAFQLTNILRDLREDADAGRTYLPRADLSAAGVSDEQLRTRAGGRAFVELVRAQVARAESYYRASADLEERIDRDSRPTLVAMTAIYHSLLKKITKDPERVLRERVSLSLLDKLRIASRATRACRASRVGRP
jgi:15-cis-phytoene synthase